MDLSTGAAWALRKAHNTELVHMLRFDMLTQTRHQELVT